VEMRGFTMKGMKVLKFLLLSHDFCRYIDFQFL